jgi:hypothetical protein
MAKKKRLSEQQAVKLAFEIASASTAVMLADNPQYIFPAREVCDRVEEVLASYGLSTE